MLKSPAPLASADVAHSFASAISELHARCGVYTKAPMVGRILDAINWTAGMDLSRSRLLEPAAGDGAFVVEAARRLLRSLRRYGHSTSPRLLAERIVAYELHEEEAAKGRTALIDVLIENKISQGEAQKLAAYWLRTADFLLQPLEETKFSHVAGNPPYARWSKIPSALRQAYEAALPPHISKGDLFLAFLDRGIASLKPRGKLGFLCSDRWQYMAFAEGFRKERLREVRIIENEEVEPEDVYQRSVDIYPSVLILEKLAAPMPPPAIKRQGKTLAELGFEVRVGPALGCTPAYVLDVGEADAEDELLAPWLAASEVQEGTIERMGKRVICLYDEHGRLRDLRDFPTAHARLLKFRKQLEARSVVRDHGAAWFRPIDRVCAKRWSAPKLLIPELAKTPRVALDTSGAIPSHGVYAIFATSPDADLNELRSRLADGGLAERLKGKAPKVKGGYVRCYKRILEAVEL
ncbi:MAG: Eco57I restriction-modification methylase domain-containing protein [Allosphingosinicella sp.]|uniref:Eco57I restriction-modification methylase domain-containing protein n=1 Tax=Allosphingosinicella sp. TaxID=2823234 RepID=UPI003962F1EF